MKKYSIVASLFAVVFFLAACGGKSGQENETRVAGTQTAQATETPTISPENDKGIIRGTREDFIGVWNIVANNGIAGDICAFSSDEDVYCIENSLGWSTYDIVDNDRLLIGADLLDVRESSQNRMVLEDENTVTYVFTRIEPQASGLKEMLAGTWISDTGGGIFYFDGDLSTAVVNDQAVQYDVLGEAVIVSSVPSVPDENETMLVEEITGDKLVLRTADNTRITLLRHKGTGGASLSSAAGTWILVWDGEYIGELYVGDSCTLVLEDVTYACEIPSDEVVILTEMSDPFMKYLLALEAASSDEIIVRTGNDDTMAYLVREGSDRAAELMSPESSSMTSNPFTITSSNADKLELLWEVRLPGSVLEVSPDGNLLAIAGGGNLTLFDLVAGTQSWTVFNRAGIGTLVFDETGEVLAIQSSNGTETRMFDVATGSELYSVEDSWPGVVSVPGSSAFIFSIHTYQNGTYRDGLVLWDSNTKSQQFFPIDGVAKVLGVSPDGVMIVLSTGDLWDVQSRAVKGRVPGVERELAEAYFDQRGRNLVTVEQRDINVIDLAEMTIKYTIDGGKPFLNTAGTQFAYTIFTGDTAIRLVDIDSGVERSFQQVMPSTDSYDFVFSPDDSVLVAVGGRMWVWSTSTGNNLSVLNGPSFSPRNGRFAQNGTSLVTSGGEQVMSWATFSPPDDSVQSPTQVPMQVQETQPVQQTRRIVFHTGDLQRYRELEIGVINLDGTGFSLLTNNRGMTNSFPQWSPEGSQIVFQSNRDGNEEIYIMNADGSGQTRLTFNRAVDVMPRWSKDGSKVIFMSDRDGDRQTYVMDRDGNNQTLSTNEDMTEALSPNGLMKAFVNLEDQFENWEIYVSDVDGTNARQLTDNSYADYWPTWSAEGSDLYFLSMRDGWSQLYRMSASGGAPVNISNTFQGVFDYSVSKDGAHIAFSDTSKLYVINSDGTGLRVIEVSAAGMNWGP